MNKIVDDTHAHRCVALGESQQRDIKGDAMTKQQTDILERLRSVIPDSEREQLIRELTELLREARKC